MAQTDDFRDKLNGHFVADLNSENTYFVAIQMAIINEIAFYESITGNFRARFLSYKKVYPKSG